jgi:hypothetical protein
MATKLRLAGRVRGERTVRIRINNTLNTVNKAPEESGTTSPIGPFGPIRRPKGSWEAEFAKFKQPNPQSGPEQSAENPIKPGNA